MRLFITENPEWGFYGEISVTGLADPAEAFDLAARKVAAATGQDAFESAAWLDSREGRHFAALVVNALTNKSTLADAIGSAVDRWMDWTISREHSKETGIPVGMPYLTGVVWNHSIKREAA